MTHPQSTCLVMPVSGHPDRKANAAQSALAALLVHVARAGIAGSSVLQGLLARWGPSDRKVRVAPRVRRVQQVNAARLARPVQLARLDQQVQLVRPVRKALSAPPDQLAPRVRRGQLAQPAQRVRLVRLARPVQPDQPAVSARTARSTTRRRLR